MSISNRIVLKDVDAQYGDQLILKDIQLKLEPETIYTVIGPSGTGKSTLLKLLAGLLEPSSGVILEGEEEYQSSHHIIGLIPQNYGLLPWQTAWQAVAENVKISMKKRKLSQEDEERMKDLFQQMDIVEVMNAYPSEMSGGQQQRVSITRAFAMASDLILMDEPFSALDAFTREAIQKLFLVLWQKQPFLTLFITHDIEEAILLGHKIIVMGEKPGRIIDIVESPFQEKTLSIERMKESPVFYDCVQKIRKEIKHDENQTAN